MGERITISTSDTQHYDTLTLARNTAISGTTLTVGAVNGGGKDLTLNLSGTSAINGNFTGIAKLTTDAAGSTTLSGTIDTTDAQVYGDKVQLVGNTKLLAPSVEFQKTVDGDAKGTRDLTIKGHPDVPDTDTAVVFRDGRDGDFRLMRHAREYIRAARVRDASLLIHVGQSADRVRGHWRSRQCRTR